MKLHILSDLHLEFLSKPPYRYELPDVGADLIVLAGDIGVWHHGAKWAARESARLGKPFIYVCGNHEFYKFQDGITNLSKIARAAATEGQVHLLEHGEATFGGVRFFGATLWTDFELYGEKELGDAVLAADRSMTDYEDISFSLKPYRMKLSPWFTKAIHHETREWLWEALYHSSAERNVVVTHHAPLPRSIARMRFPRPLLGAAYASNLGSLFSWDRVALWIHGHTHRFRDYLHEGTRVVCNPKGYPDQEGFTGFRPRFVVEV